MVYIPRDGNNPTIALKPGEEVDIPTSRAVKGLTAKYTPTPAKVKKEEVVAPKPKTKSKKVSTNALDNTKD
jgi:hypothetical protein